MILIYKLSTINKQLLLDIIHQIFEYVYYNKNHQINYNHN
jgi:hypothetical protein